MASVRELRRTVGIIIVVLAVIALAAGIALFTPIAGSRAQREATFRQVHRQYQQRAHEAIPFQHIDQKLKQASQQIDQFYQQRFFTRDSDVAQELGRLAQQNGVSFSAVHYNYDDTDIPGIEQLSVDGSLAGDYSKIIKFINGLERDRMFFLVNNVVLAQEQSGRVRVEMKLQTFMRRT
jgi:Tfp pilus assembly protein PilO